MRLLGDMRSYNFVFDITQDFDDVQFKIRSIDFDQQSYEGSKNIYLPQFFKENLVFVELVKQHLNSEVIMQYQQEERSQIIRRIKSERQRLRDLRVAAAEDPLSTEPKIKQLAGELSVHYNNNPVFLNCTTMPQLMYQHLKELLISEQSKECIDSAIYHKAYFNIYFVNKLCSMIFYTLRPVPDYAERNVYQAGKFQNVLERIHAPMY